MSSTEKSSSAATDDEVLATLTAYNLAVGKVSRTVRHLLPQHHGYECKEPEPGKFTLAFRCLQICPPSMLTKPQDSSSPR